VEGSEERDMNRELKEEDSTVRYCSSSTDITMLRATLEVVRRKKDAFQRIGGVGTVSIY